MQKSTIAEIRQRFDKDVERFSNLDTGQSSTMDAEITLELLTGAAKILRPEAVRLLDVGCGAGNYTLKMLSKLPNLQCTLIDLSQPMLEKALERVRKESLHPVEIFRGDIREIELPANHFDIILAGAVLHHLREDADWEFVFKKLFTLLNAGGCLMISDLILQENELVNQFMWHRYGDYLEKMAGAEYRQKVLNYIEKEDSPRSLNFQLELMKISGFTQTEILHKNGCFAAWYGVK